MAEKSSWDQANILQKLGLVWRNRKKIRQIIKDYFYFIITFIITTFTLSVHNVQQVELCLVQLALGLGMEHLIFYFCGAKPYDRKRTWFACLVLVPSVTIKSP
jgi:hypothetical protein